MQWLQAAKAGDSEAIDQMLEALMSRLYPLCLKMTSNSFDAEDCLQNSLIRIMNSLNSFAGKASFFTWCYRITINICYDFLRHKSRQQEDLWADDYAGLSAQNQIPVSEEAERAEIVSEIRAALLCLSEPFRDTVILYELGGFSVNEIATLQEIPAGTVKSRLSRGRAQLAQTIQEREGNKILNSGTIQSDPSSN